MTNGKICPCCNVELRPEANGVVMVEMSTHGPLALYMADVWGCPDCKLQVVPRVADKPFLEHFNADLAKEIGELRLAGGRVIPFFANTRERDAYRQAAVDLAVETAVKQSMGRA